MERKPAHLFIETDFFPGIVLNEKDILWVLPLCDIVDYAFSCDFTEDIEIILLGYSCTEAL